MSDSNPNSVTIMSSEDVSTRVEETISPLRLSGETTSRRRSPENSNTSNSHTPSGEQSVVVDLEGVFEPLTTSTSSSTTTTTHVLNRERALASFMAHFLPAIASSGSGGNSGASNVVSRALNDLTTSNANEAQSSSDRRSAHRSRRGPLQLRSIFSEWRSSNSDLSSDTESDDGSRGRTRSFRSSRRSTASRPLLPTRSDSTPTNNHVTAGAGLPVDLSRLLSPIRNPDDANDNPDAENTGNIPPSEPNGSNDAEDGGNAGEPNPNSPRSLLRTLLPLMSKGVPFLLIIIVKVLWEHSMGILVMLGLSLTFFHANKMLKNQVSLKERRSMAVLVWIVVFLSSDVYLIFLVFQTQELGNSLIFLNTNAEESKFGLWHLLWVMGITDFVIRFAAITFKAFVVTIPRKWLPYKFRGKYYLLIETLSHFYRHLTPIRPWLRYLWGEESDNQILGGVLVVLYSMLKLNSLRIVIKDCFVSLKAVRRYTSYGTMPSKKALNDACAESGADEIGGCPICQEEFKDPVELSCKHIFCEECVSMWFDRERTCPLCRATIADDPKWRDGSTSYALQLY